MANEKNLIPYSERSENEARENGRKGGIASGESRRKRKLLKDSMNALLELPVSSTKAVSYTHLDVYKRQGKSG